MTWVALSLGSNTEPEANLSSCLDELLLRFHDLALSSVFRSAAKDRSGPDYLNMAVGFDTDLPLAELHAELRKIEDKHGRDRRAPRAAQVTLDIDVLAYGDKAGTFGGVTVPRPEILDTAHVLRPLAQVGGKRRHPVTKQTYSELWKAFDAAAQPLAAVDFEWHERIISRRGG